MSFASHTPLIKTLRARLTVLHVGALAITLAVNAVISAVYYLRLISVMYFDAGTVVNEPARQPAAWIAGLLCSAATLALFVAPQWLWTAAMTALR